LEGIGLRKGRDMDNIWIVGACVAVLCLWLFLVWLFGQAARGPEFGWTTRSPGGGPRANDARRLLAVG
jgi:hypothetical protein